MKSNLSTRPLNLALLLVLVVSMAPPTIAHSGFLSSRNLAVQVQSRDNLWVDAIAGNDEYDGLSRATAFRSIQRAAAIAGPGTTVHILPGIYREIVRPILSGSAAEPIIYRAENGLGTVIIRGSEQADTLAWIKLDTNSIGLPRGVDHGNLYYADLSAWMLDGSPRFVVQLGGDGNGDRINRLPLAREPDWHVAAEWKYAEFWWAADGGSDLAACDPSSNRNPDCDASSRSSTQLTDRNSDSAPTGIEPGNLMTLGDLTGATLVALDTNEGHYTYRRKIVAHDVTAGKITVDRLCEFDAGSGRPGLGWGSKYFTEDHPALIDTPGEWWYDDSNSRLYLWPPESGSPATLNIEISRRDYGFLLNNLSYITLDGLTMELFNENGVQQSQSCPDCGSSYNTIRNATLRYANVGIELGQGTDDPGSVTDGFTLEDSEVSHMDTFAIHLNYWWQGQSADSFTHAGIVNTVIRNNEMFDLGFRTDSDNANGLQFNYVDNFRFEKNYVHHVAHNGMELDWSIIQSAKDSGFAPDEIRTGGILIKDNIFEKACLLAADCGELKIAGRIPDNHVFRDVLITGNIFRNTFGWTYISERRRAWSGGTRSEVKGMGGFGLYLDNASGVHVYRNIAYNNAYSGFHLYNYWWDGNIVLYNNVAANSLHGIYLGGDTQSSINTQIANNIIVNNEGYGILIYQPQWNYGNFLVDHNLYYSNGWRVYKYGGMEEPGDMALYRPNKSYQTLSAIQANMPWEKRGVEGNPGFWNYDSNDHNLFDGSWPDFHLTPASQNALDTGTTTLPDSLTALLDAFEVTDLRYGGAYAIGRYEQAYEISGKGPPVRASPTVQVVCPGGIARYTLQHNRPDLPYSIFLAVTSPSPFLKIELGSSILTSDGKVTLTIVNMDDRSIILPALEYTVPIVANGAGFTETTSVRLLVGGIGLSMDDVRICLPIGL